MVTVATCIKSLSVRDIRFPTSLEKHGSDAMHVDPDYSCAYVVAFTDGDVKGYGMTFTLGRGTELVVEAVKALSPIVVGKKLDIFKNLGAVWREITSETQLRWVGPEKGVIHLAAAAIMNALWDLWARLEHKPLWQLLTDMEPEELVSTIDFRYLSDVLTKEEAINMLKDMQDGKEKRMQQVIEAGYPAYTTQVGWLGYSDEQVRDLCRQFMREGFTAFKLKVGQDLERDKQRCALIRDIIGKDHYLMADANQKWDVPEAIEWMKHLQPYDLLWIEEPTSPDDILGHAAIRKALSPLGIGVATGEMCANRVMFKQFLQAEAIDFCQIDSCRIAGVNEILSVYLMAKKFGIPVCPHAGGVGLCEMVQHLQIFDYICLSGTTERRMIEWVDHLHEHFKAPPEIRRGRYMPPSRPGYSTEMYEDSLIKYEYPYGSQWIEYFQKGTFKEPWTKHH